MDALTQVNKVQNLTKLDFLESKKESETQRNLAYQALHYKGCYMIKPENKVCFYQPRTQITDEKKPDLDDLVSSL